jgi:hypothetical protein
VNVPASPPVYSPTSYTPVSPSTSYTPLSPVVNVPASPPVYSSTSYTQVSPSTSYTPLSPVVNVPASPPVYFAALFDSLDCLNVGLSSDCDINTAPNNYPLTEELNALQELVDNMQADLNVG